MLIFYPYIQLGLIILFILVSYLAFSSSRKAEHYFLEGRSTHFLQALRSCYFILDHGKGLCFFPEGLRSTTGEIGEFKKGFGVLAKETGAKLVPVAIIGAHAAWPSSCRPRQLTSAGSAPIWIITARKSATVFAFSQCARIRRSSVSRLFRCTQALNGLRDGPTLRK